METDLAVYVILALFMLVIAISPYCGRKDRDDED